MKQKIPKNLHRYFWDVNPVTIDLTTHRRYVIERLLEAGDTDAIQFLRDVFSEDELRETLKTTRALSPKSAVFWANIFQVNPEDILCLQKDFLKRRAAHWIT